MLLWVKLMSMEGEVRGGPCLQCPLVALEGTKPLSGYLSAMHVITSLSMCPAFQCWAHRDVDIWLLDSWGVSSTCPSTVWLFTKCLPLIMHVEMEKKKNKPGVWSVFCNLTSLAELWVSRYRVLEFLVNNKIWWDPFEMLLGPPQHQKSRFHLSGKTCKGAM